MHKKIAFVWTYLIYQFLAIFADTRVQAFVSSTLRRPLSLFETPIPSSGTRIFLERRNNNLPKSFFLPPQQPLLTMTNTTTLTENDALSHLMEVAIALQSQQWNSIRILEKLQLSSVDSRTVHDINSILFVLERNEKETQGQQQYVLAIVSQSDRVNISKLQNSASEVMESTNCMLSLAPTEYLSRLCGFESGCVPPLGLMPSPIATFVDESLLYLPQEIVFLVGGGGTPSQSTLLPLRTLLDFVPNVHTACFRQETGGMMTSPEVTSQSIQKKEGTRFKPYFCVEPPDTELAMKILKGSENNDIALSPESFTIVGRVSGVRQIARRLVFADFAPPPHHHNDDEHYVDDHPWRNPRTKDDMAVQLVLGKTIMENLGDEDGEAAVRSLKKGQLIMMRGTTNVDKLDSLINWTSKRSLDVRVSEYQVLQTSRGDEDGIFSREQEAQPSRVPKKRGNTGSKTISSATLDMEFLRLSDVYKDASQESLVTIVDTPEAARRMHKAISEWLVSNPNQSGLVGVDCEWKPNFRADPSEAQPVLLMQVCFHPMQQIYLLDLQTLLRPLLQRDAPKNAIEASTSEVIEILFQPHRLIKTGFKVMNDFKRLAASYPHISAFRVVNTVLELSRTGMRVMQLTKQAESIKATSSLSKMTEFFLSKTLNKYQQVSDWSIRPMTSAQIEYASLDAVITPYLIEHLLQQVNVEIDNCPKLGRWDNDTAFADALKSWKFIVLNQKEDYTAIQRLNAKRVVGPSFVVTQSWITGSEMPNEPDVPVDENEPYRDVYGVTRVPSHTVSIPDDSKDTLLDPLIGLRIAKSKDDCLSEVLKGHKILQQPGYKLDFPQRSGCIEFENSVALFVTMPLRTGQPRKYPNEWMQEGSMLSWFIHDHEWGDGDSRLAKKMTYADGTSEPTVILFVRRGKEPFLCCGRCHVDPLGYGEKETIGNIVMLHLVLRDWDKLRSFPEFQQLLLQ
jgi:prolyl-tRNA editing enzyme YbaK/EbsC (Cys-tRNA(Pro) deacylase)